jgi:hypothetical protein
MKRKLNKDNRSKKAYTRPTVKRVPLRPEEAVLAICKITLDSGANGANCANPTACSTITS